MMALIVPGVPDFAKDPKKWLAAKEIAQGQANKLNVSILELTIAIYRKMGGELKACKKEDFKKMSEEYKESEAEAPKEAEATAEAEKPVEAEPEQKEKVQPADPDKPYKPIDSIGLYGSY